MESALTTANLIDSLRPISDSIWEIDLGTFRTRIWHDTMTPEMTGSERDFSELIRHYLERHIVVADREKCLLEVSPDALRTLAASETKRKHFDMRLYADASGFEWHETFCQAFTPDNGSTGTVLFWSRCVNSEKRNSIIETAVRQEYDYIAYLEADNNSYVMYSANFKSGTPLPPVVGTDYTHEMVTYNMAHCLAGDREKVIHAMRLDHVLEKMAVDGEYVIYTQVQEDNRLAYKKIRYSYYDRSRNILLVSRIDITEIRKEKQQKQLLQDALNAANVANRAKSEFLSRMSHDIRTPMNAIIGMTAIAGTHLHNTERLSDCLQKITTSSRLLLSLINEVLDMAKIESGRIVLAEEEVHLGDLIQSMMSMIQPDLKKKRHRFDIHLFELQKEWVVCDTQRIQQVLLNFLTNAIKYTPESGHIVFDIHQLPGRERGFGLYKFVFSDNGIGMTPEFLEKVFEPFERANEASIMSVQGTGLGMAIAKNIVEIMGGEIEVKSEYGKGTTFTATLPLRLAESAHTFDTLPCLPVLVVDDDTIVCENTCRRLNEIGMDSEWVTSGEEALRKISGHHEGGNDYFAAIIDLQMPGMNGIETAREIRKIVGPNITIILLSAYDWSEFETEARSAGIDDFIQKPLLKSRLVYTLKKYMGKNLPDAENIPSETAAASIPLAGKRALIVEDNPLNMEIATELIGMMGIETDTAENGQVALDKMATAAEGFYDLVLMDMQMPVMDGCEATRQIRALNRWDVKTLPILAMTANAFAEDIEKTRRAGMNEHIAKPIDVVRLKSVLERWLKQE